MKHRLITLIGIALLLAGVGLSTPFLMPQLLATQPVTAASNARPVIAEEPTISGAPVSIAFPGQKIDIAVVPGYYDAKSATWSLSSDKAQFASTTSEPNNKSGNTFIYGHNRWQVFTGLLYAKPGDQAIVKTANGHTFTYQLRSIVDAEPTDVSHMNPTTEPVLTVQTCSGLQYEKRRILTFELKEVI